MTQWLIDKSALVRLSLCAEVGLWANRIERGLVRITSLTRLEVGFSARSGDDLRQAISGAPLAWMPTEYLTPTIENRAIEVQQQLADLGRHRGPSIPDLMIAATAELASLVVLHVDKDFEIIASITHQPVERLEVT